MKVKHSKYKNTGILFELLTRQLTSDTIAGNNPKSLNILQKYFNSKSELLKEYKIYHTLATKKFKSESKANILISTLVEAFNRLSKTKLRREKYNLIKEIKENFDITDFLDCLLFVFLPVIFSSKVNFESNIDFGVASLFSNKLNMEAIIL